ncbi:MAG: hypothetical protein M1118_07645 [Chloroflexi bacterium]|nr:hypothetical protein [Chloroflexota bacterium]
MRRETDMRPVAAELYFLPVDTRLPLKFGRETLTSIVVARVRLNVEDVDGRRATGWGETPLNVQWVWPSELPYDERLAAIQALCGRLTSAWADFAVWGHPLEVGHAFVEQQLPALHSESNRSRAGGALLPYLAALVCCSPFDLALHDAYGKLLGLPTYTTYGPPFLTRDLAQFITPAPDSPIRFAGLFPQDFLASRPPSRLVAWHLVGGKDPITPEDLTGSEPNDGYPVLLRDWIRSDGLTCLKVKLAGNDERWDYERLVAVGRVAIEEGCLWLSADFNCTVPSTDYVNTILDRLLYQEPRIYGMLLYVEQPFPYDLESHRLDVRSVAARKPLFLDESAHDWRHIELGRRLGWSGVALKTCKTQTGSLLSLSWARAHGMTLMVQDLTNPMLAQIPHVLLAAHAQTIMGVETNAVQFYPEASHPEAAVHPGLFQRRGGAVDLSTVKGSGFGYRCAEIERVLPAPVVVAGS